MCIYIHISYYTYAYTYVCIIYTYMCMYVNTQCNTGQICWRVHLVQEPTLCTGIQIARECSETNSYLAH